MFETMEVNMEKKVTKKQHISKDCFICGTENIAGLKMKFYELENGELAGIFTAQDIHQSYPNRAHGGILAAILDEAIGRSMMLEEPDSWGVTVELNLKYKKPVPLNEELKVIARPVRNTRKIFEAEGEILLNNGDVAVTAYGKYVKMPVSKISENVENIDDFMHYEEEKGPEKIDY